MAAKLAANIAAMRSVPGRTTRSAWQARSRWSLDDPPARRTSIPPRVYITPPRRRGRVTSPRVMLLADRRAPCRPILPRTLPACPDAECPLPRRPPESAAAPEAMRFPPSVFPLWKPPFQIPPFQADSTKGANRRGNRTAAFLENGAKPPKSRRFSSAPFSAAALRVAPPPPPLNQPLALDPTLGVSALVGPATARALARCRPSKVHAKRVGSSPPKSCAAGFPDEASEPQNPPRFFSVSPWGFASARCVSKMFFTAGRAYGAAPAAHPAHRPGFEGKKESELKNLFVPILSRCDSDLVNIASLRQIDGQRCNVVLRRVAHDQRIIPDLLRVRIDGQIGEFLFLL